MERLTLVWDPRNRGVARGNTARGCSCNRFSTSLSPAILIESCSSVRYAQAKEPMHILHEYTYRTHTAL